MKTSSYLSPTILRQKTIKALQEELVAIMREKYSLSQQKIHSAAVKKTFKTHLIRFAKKNIARIKTILAEKLSEIPVTDETRVS